MAPAPGNISATLNGGKVKAVQLVEGSVVPTDEPRTKAEELSLCERYFQSSYPNRTAPGTVMGASPTVTFYGPNDATANRIYNQNQAANRIVSPVNISAESIGYPLINADDTAPAVGDLLLWHWTAEAEL